MEGLLSAICTTTAETINGTQGIVHNMLEGADHQDTLDLMHASNLLSLAAATLRKVAARPRGAVKND